MRHRQGPGMGSGPDSHPVRMIRPLPGGGTVARTGRDRRWGEWKTWRLCRSRPGWPARCRPACSRNWRTSRWSARPSARRPEAPVQNVVSLVGIIILLQCWGSELCGIRQLPVRVYIAAYGKGMTQRPVAAVHRPATPTAASGRSPPPAGRHPRNTSPGPRSRPRPSCSRTSRLTSPDPFGRSRTTGAT